MGNEIYYNLRADEVDEESRLRYREEVKTLLDKIAAEKLHVAEFEAVIAATEADTDVATAEHGGVCGPAQSALKAADEKTLAAVRAKQPIPPEVAAERVAALKTIATANAELEARVDANKSTIAEMRASIHRARMKIAEQAVLQTSLRNLASQDVRDRFNVVADRLEWARKRQVHSQAMVALNTNRIQSEEMHEHPDHRHIRVYKARMREHSRITEDAQADIAKLQTDVQALQQQMLDE